MKKIGISILSALIICLFAGGGLWAGQGNPGGNGPHHEGVNPGGSQNGDGEGYFFITDGIPFTFEYALVVSYAAGQGLVLSTVEIGEVTVYGVGPQWYWENQGIDRPSVGERITVTGYSLTTENTEIYVIMSILVEGETEAIQLRDPETGEPLWRSARRHQATHAYTEGKPNP